MGVPASPRGFGGAAGSHRLGLASIGVFTILLAACSAAASPTPAPATTGPATPAPATPAPATPAPATQGTGAGGAVTVGSNYSDPTPKGAFAAMLQYCDGKAGTTSTINTVDHNTFQNQISTYLQGTPDDVFTWFAGYRMRFFASQGLATDISDVWNTIGANYSDAMKSASTGDDGKQYFVPMYNYPWVVMYNKSVWQQKGYQVPTTWDQFLALAAKMQGDGLIPIAFADKDGWPAMGTFDILDMRLNGYQFHIDLMAGKEKWTDPKVTNVFTTWAKLLPFYQQGALGLTWQEAAQGAMAGTSGMYFLGTFATQQATAAQLPNIDFFAWPGMGTQYDAEQAIDAPIDGLMLSKSPKNLTGAKALLACVGTAGAQAVYGKSDPSNVSAVKNADTSNYNDIQKKSAAIIASSQKIAQFLDRDTRPDFAGPNGMQQFLQKWLTTPTQDMTAFQKSIQDFWDTLPQQ